MATLITPEPAGQAKPYVGPRTFQPSERERFFGRDREARDLVARIVSERFTLFYAQSGAGKSSLINTRVVPGLEAEGFEVLPVARVSGHSGAEVATDNIFVYNLLASLHQQEEPPPGLATMSITHFLENLVCHEGIFFYDAAYEWPADAQLMPRVLIIDQFEEIITTNSAYWAQREPFFRQLGEALDADDSLWIVLALREDFLANLDPYLHLVNQGVRQRFYMQHLDRDAALLAICRPVENLRPFEEGAAESLLNNLLTSRRQADDGEIHPAEFVEPVQLQAVCYQMWEKLQTHPGPTITCQDVEDFADVDTALISFYEDTIADTVAWATSQPELAVSEIDLRHWFDTKLVTEAGTRNMVFRGREVTGELPTVVADYIKSRFILREVVRPGGGVWYELVHDRFIQPIREANQKWLQDQPLLQLAQQWAGAGRSESHLLAGDQLDDYSATKWEALGPLVAEFMAASRSGQQKYERRRRLIQTAAVAMAMVVLAGLAIFLYLVAADSQAKSDEVSTRNAELAQSNAEKDANATAVAAANAAIQSQNQELTLRGAELAVANNVLSAFRLADNAADYLAQGRLEPAILLSYKALNVDPNDPSRRIRSILFNAISRKIEQGTPESDLRGLYAAPLDDDGRPLPLSEIFPGPLPDSVATLVDGVIYWWPVEGEEGPPVAVPFDSPAAQDFDLQRAAFHAGQGLLVTVSPAGLRLWRFGDEAADPVELLPAGVDGSVLAFSDDGRYLAVAHTCAGVCEFANLIDIFATDSPGESDTVSPHQSITPSNASNAIVDLAFLRQGRQLAWTDSQTVFVEDLSNGTRAALPRLSAQKQVFGALAVSPVDDLLIVAGCDKPSPGLPAGPAPVPTQTPAPPATGQSISGGPGLCTREDKPWLEWWFLGPEKPANFLMDVPTPLDMLYLPSREQMLFIRQDSSVGVFTYGSVSVEAAQANACQVAGRNLTAEEWLQANPEKTLEGYDPYCEDLPIHPTVLEDLIQTCRDPQGASESQACWKSLSERIGDEIDPEQLRSFDDLIAAGRDSLAAQHRTTTLRYLAEAGALAQAMPADLSPLLSTTLSVEYANLCNGGLFTDSPALSESCAYGTSSTQELLGSSTEAGGEQRRWRFLGEEGEILIASVAALEGGDPTLALLDGDGVSELAYNDDFDGFNPRITYQFVEDEAYMLEVGWLGVPGRYVLTTKSEIPARLEAGTPANADGADRGLWSFDGRAGDFVSLALDAGDQGHDARLRLMDSQFTPLAFNDDFTGFDPQLEIPLTADGSYIVEVSWNGAPGPYSLTLDKTEIEGIAVGDVIEDIDPDRQKWRFDGQVGDYVSIAVAAPNIDTDPLLRLIGPRGVELTYSDTYHSGEIDPQTEQLELLLVEDGSYSIEVDWLSETVVPYTITTRLVEAAPFAIGQNIDVDPEQPLWRFDGRAGQQVTISAESFEGSDIYLQLYDDQFNRLAEASSTFNSPVAQISTVLTYNGPYIVSLGWFFTPGQVSLTSGSAEPPLLPPGEPQPATADQLIWRYEGEPGEIVVFTAETETFQEMWLQLRNDEYAVVSFDDSYDGGLFPQITYRLPETGSVFVEVGWYDEPRPYLINATLVDSQPLIIGEPVAEAGPDRRFWTIEGRAGDLVAFAVQALDGTDPNLILRDEAFAELARNENFSGVYDPQIAYLLPEDGLYYLEVGWNDTPGLYSLSANVLEPESLPFERTVAAGGGSLWTFAGKAGDFVEIVLEAPEDSYNWLRLLDTQFWELSYAEEADDRQNPEITYLLPEDGVYSVEVGSNDAPAPYTLRVSRTAPVALPLDESVPAGNDGRTAWVFAGQTGDIVSAAVTALDDGDTRLTLFDRQYFPLADSDDFDDLNPRIIARLPADGFYILDMGWQNWLELGDLVTTIAPRFGPYHLDAAILEPELLPGGETVVEATAAQRLWRFQGQAGDTVSFAAIASSSGDNLWLRLLDDLLQPVAFNDNADGLNPRLESTLPRAGEYYLEAGWFGPPGAYQLVSELN